MRVQLTTESYETVMKLLKDRQDYLLSKFSENQYEKELWDEFKKITKAIIHLNDTEEPAYFKNKEELKESLITLYGCMQDSNVKEHYRQRDMLGTIIEKL